MKDITKNKFATNKVAKKIKAESRLREAERDIDLGNVIKVFHKKKKVNYGDRLTKIAVWFALVCFLILFVAQIYLAL